MWEILIGTGNCSRTFYWISKKKKSATNLQVEKHSCWGRKNWYNTEDAEMLVKH